MATIGNLWINVKSNTKGLSKGLGKARGMLAEFAMFAASPVGLAVVGFAALTAGVIVASKAIMSATKEFMKFEAGMAEVKSILLDVSDSDFGRLEDSAKQLGATTAFTAEEASGGMANLARAGFSTNEILAATPAVLNLASATGMELAEASNIAAVAVRGFGLEATETAHVADVLALAASKTNTTVTEMGDAMSYVAPVANQLGFTIEETSAMLGKLADAGIKGSKGGTALRTIMLKLGGTIEKEGTGALRDYFKAQHSVTENMEKFGKIGVTAAGVLSGVVDETDQLTTAMTEAVGVVDKMADTRLDTLEGDVTLFQSAVSGLKTEIGEKLAPTFREIVQVATKFIGGLQAAFSSVFEGVEGSIISTETLMTVFKVLGGLIIGYATIVGSTYNKIAFVINSIKALVYGLVAAIVLQVSSVVKAVAWGLDAIGVISSDTYNDIKNTSDLLVEDLANSALEAAEAAGVNFVDGFAGGAEAAGLKAYDAFSDSMDGIITQSEEGGKEVAEGIAEGIGSGAGAVATALETLTDEQMELVDAGSKLATKLQEQVKYFGLTEAEILKVKQAEKGLTTATMEQALALEKELQALNNAESAKQKATQDAEALASAAQSVIDSLRTPQEVYDAEVANLQKMFDAKLLTIEQFAAAVNKLKMGTEDDIEVNVVMKGVVEGLQTALGTVKVGGQVDDTLRVAEEGNDIQQKIAELMASVENATVESMNLNESTEKSVAETADAIRGTLTTEVDGLEGMIGEVNSSIGTIATGLTMDATESLIQTTNELTVQQNQLLSTMNDNITALGQVGTPLS